MVEHQFSKLMAGVRFSHPALMYERINADGPFTHKQWWHFLRGIYTNYDGMTLSQSRLATVLQDVASGKTIFMKRVQDNGLKRGKLWVEGDGGARRFVTLVVDEDSQYQGLFARPVTALKPDAAFRSDAIEPLVATR